VLTSPRKPRGPVSVPPSHAGLRATYRALALHGGFSPERELRIRRRAGRADVAIVANAVTAAGEVGTEEPSDRGERGTCLRVAGAVRPLFGIVGLAVSPRGGGGWPRWRRVHARLPCCWRCTAGRCRR